MTESAGTVPYRGRFAPTPSGPLHLGSLVTALASFLQARRAGGQWLLRIDDLDRARCPPGTDAVILKQLETHGLRWDGAIRYQSAHRDEYLGALSQLECSKRVYPCSCTRQLLRTSCRAGPDDPVYPGTCRAGPAPGKHASLRLRLDSGSVCFDDAGFGRQCRRQADEIGDFVVRRADGIPAYQLACAVDEAAQAITEVMRGADLLGSTFRQRLVQEALGLTPPRYHHLPLLLDARGRKLSKQNHAPAVRGEVAHETLVLGLELLGQSPPAGLEAASVHEILDWGIRHWNAGHIPQTTKCRAGAAGRGYPLPL
jgi:glutamyl-Q tRNA(Asp) synthetase